MPSTLTLKQSRALGSNLCDFPQGNLRGRKMLLWSGSSEGRSPRHSTTAQSENPMNKHISLSCLAACALLTGTTQAQILEDFEGGNPDNWRMEFDGTFNGFSIPAIPGTHSATGGNPDGMLSWTQIQSPVNVWHLNNDGNSDWKGDFRARGVEGVTMDMKYTGNSPFGMHMYVVIADDMGTPEITDDILIWSPFDPATYGFAGFGAALPENTWNSLTWALPSASTFLPAGWTVWSHSGTNSGNDTLDWNNVIQDVDYLAFVNGAPWGGTTFGFIDIDFDNLGIDTGAVGTPFCFCDGTGLGAPCGNTGAAGHGCGNSGSAGGSLLVAEGNPNVGASTVKLTATGAPSGNFGMFFQGETQAGGGQGLLFNDGFRCAFGPVKRLEIVTTDGTGAAQTSVNIATAGAIPLGGATRTYQFWYRDMGNTCSGQGFNFSNAWAVQWLP